MSNSSNLSDGWPGSTIDQMMLQKAIGAFLRTHRGGGRLLIDYLLSAPADRSEEQYEQEVEAAAAENEAAIQKILDNYNAERAAEGLPPVDRQGNPVSDSAGS